MYQKLIIIGNLGRDPIMRLSPDGNAVTNFNMATSRKYGEKEETTWFKVAVWGKSAEACDKYLHKGSRVLVEGRLKAGSPTVYQRDDGQWAASYEVNADNVQFLSGKDETVRSYADDATGDYNADDDIPF